MTDPGGESLAADRSVRAYASRDEDAVREVMLASLAVDRIPGFVESDIDRALVRLRAQPERGLVAVESRVVIGYCVPRHDDLTVHPQFRRRGHGRALVSGALELVRRQGLSHLQLYGPSHLPATRSFIEALGFRYHSSMWEFRLAPGEPVSEPTFPPDVAVRPFDDDVDFDAFVALLNESFADHPTPLDWTPDVIRSVNSQPDFDPNGLLLVSPADEPGRLIAFTKVEIGTRPSGHPNPAEQPNGSIDLIGVLPPWRGRGLGRELLRWGIHYLRGRGAGRIDLSVHALNERATRIYRRAGFLPAIEWPQYTLPVDAPLYRPGGEPSSVAVSPKVPEDLRGASSGV